ncbi:PD-(D/E)XK nuclease family protein [Fructilactobacillus fructivorans]|uniref:ATP-dependent helicase/deoxyribonuclease subunit B n=1 Tax=Fructilactobacillus fructivorans TaxID=1614 RepID=A0AAE6TWZ8_9LACO|nr:PD-(D/E)XK nuclease family protein [Fructilactobacillus fructivorans]KRK56925.1 ATP-dependent helicase deoxyribonuclease subunit B [Fructilactobacillus fructivorans]QFX93224.1 ATP-dependent helicase [Fructilactobacillus fructivorans]RDV65044.1 ATP-dependent helicase [Fructilactobacillus fructivorans]
MALQFVLGKASNDHFKKVIDNLDHSMQQHSHDTYFYLVPNHIKFESELGTLKQLNHDDQSTFAETRVQVFSFSRLMWYFLGNSKGYQLPRLSKDAVNMIIFQIIENYQDKLTVFKGEGAQPGFISQVADQINELQQGRIDPDTLDKIADLDPGTINPELQGKLHDISVIYREFLKETDGKYVDSSVTLKMLNQYLTDTDLSQMHFYISGFSQFSAQELEIVKTLIDKANGITIDLNLDHAYPNEMPDSSAFFLRSGRLYHQLYQYARASGTKVMTDQYANDCRCSDGLRELEDYWIASSEVGSSIQPKTNGNPDVALFRADSNYDELMNIATMIRQMVATGRFRYSDFMVVTRHLDKYQNVIDPIFQMQQIPYFVDIQKHMDNHPLVELIDALFSIYRADRKRNYRYDDVMRLLKSELLIPHDQEGNPMNIDRYRRCLSLCENLILKNGYEGKRWTQDEDWEYATISDNDTGIVSNRNKEISADINVIRHFVKNTLPPFYKKMAKAKTGKDAANILYQFLDENGVINELKHWQDEATERGDLQEAGQSEQVWNTLCGLLDDFVTFLGDHPFEMDNFLDLLKAGFEGASYSQIPSTLDQVTISETGLVQLNNKKVTFVMGADDNSMPATIENNSLLNDADRDQMNEQFTDDQYLNDNSETQMVNEPYLNYLAFMTPDSKLVFSYNLGGGESDVTQAISPYVARIKDHFNLEEKHVSATPSPDSNDIRQYVGSKRATLKYLVKASLDAKVNGKQLGQAWTQIKSYLENDPTMRTITQKLMGSLTYKNVPAALKPEIVTGLYGNSITTSISKLEEFYYDPYEYFLKYGLRLKERDEFNLDPSSTGTFYHESLDKLIKEINDKHIDITDLSNEQIRNMVNKITGSIIEDDPDLQYEILKSSNRMEYISKQLVQTVMQMATTLRDQSHYTKMRPKNTEIIFGEPGKPNGIDGLNFDLGDHHSVNVRGRIDRIDQMFLDGTEYLGIVDYKSSDRDIDLSEAYDGTRMQMMTYLDAVVQNQDKLSSTDKAKLASALYMHIFDPVLKPSEVKNFDDIKQIEAALMKKHKYSGLLVNNDGMLKDMVNNVADSSMIYPYKFDKNGNLYKDSVKKYIIEPHDLELLLRRTEERIKNAGKQIFDGNIKLEPSQYKDKSKIIYSPYKPVMQFDPLLTENNYRIVKDMGDNKDVIDFLREEERNNGGQ